MNIVAIFPALAAVWWTYKYDHRRAYLDVYLFSLFLLPGWCRFMAPGAPDPTFQESAILPIAAVFVLKVRRPWKFSLADALVVFYAAVVGYSEYVNAGYNDAQNLMFDMIVSGVFPYLLAKGIIEPGGMRIAFARRIVWYLAVLAIFFAYEFRVAFNPYRLVFDRFFPGQGEGWVTTFRYGFARTAGPFGHAILAGIVIMVGFRLQRWLECSGAWEARFRKFHVTSLSKARMLTLTMLAALGMTMVRGPQIGAVIASAVSAIGAGKNPRKRALWMAAAILAVGIPAGIAAYSYASVGRAAAKTTSQESAAYRKELIDKYVDIALQHSTLGWGRNGWPKVPGMPSIDNYYLLLSLMHGLIATGTLLLLIIAMIARLLANGIRAGASSPKGSSLSFSLAGIFAGFAFSILTVYMGDNVIPIFFTIVGFAEGHLLAGGDMARRQVLTAEPAKISRRFAVVFD